MKETKVKPTETIGDDKPILTWQVQRIMKNCSYQEDTKNERVQWVTGDVNRTSLKSITQAQAKKIIMQQEGLKLVNQPKPKSDNWGAFDKDNQQHRTLLSQLHTLQWTIRSEKWGEVADIGRLSEFLKSDKSPVNKPLKNMEPWEVSKIIECFKSMITKKYK